MTLFNSQKKLSAAIALKLNKSISKGTLVTCNPDECYISYSQFIKKHPKYAIRFAYKCYPKTDSTYKVLGIYKHVMDDFWDHNDYVIVVESTANRQIFLMGEFGVEPTKTIADKAKKIKETLK
jgi:hypothetical protein